MSPLNYCSHCGMEGNRMSLTATCTNCNCKLASKVCPFIQVFDCE